MIMSIDLSRVTNGTGEQDIVGGRVATILAPLDPVRHAAEPRRMGSTIMIIGTVTV